ncbi:hypothetical protein SAMN05444159_1321 [Bradyrhizobium lablabi]|uniref:Uncharacterized protein n=1 Tax=Bradyrhizobium lablabi TaxID=722472 RepID=A0A1M6LM03_9BRAD|nr:hypothetical protein [Bradyrhizobium lablabi]SHJ72281.1 hypothetical protein SAMN05444159_1321 [Bradyrhizobium lablabi]
MTPSEQAALIDRLTTMARWQRDNMTKTGVYNNFTNGSLAEEAAAALCNVSANASGAGGLREALEKIITSAMSWHPSENGPSYTDTKKILFDRLAALPDQRASAQGCFDNTTVAPTNRELHDAIATAMQQDGLTYSGIQQAVKVVQSLYAVTRPHPRTPGEK